MTVRFLGQVSAEQLERVSKPLRQIRFSPFPVRLGQPGTFGRGASVRVAWIGLAVGAGDLASLAGEVEAACRAAGLEAETRHFNPHLTLARARARRGDALPALPQLPSLPAWTVAGFNLYRSRTGPGSPVYPVLEEFSA